MKRIALTDEFGNPTGTWFDLDRATRYEEATESQWDHEWLWKTASGRWILNTWSQRSGAIETYCEIDQDTAEKWLIGNYHADALAEDIVEAHEVGAGKTPQRTIRLADDLWQAAQDRARAEGTDASGLIRRLLAEYVAQSLT